MPDITPSSMSDAHSRPELRSQNPLYERAGSASEAFRENANGQHHTELKRTNERNDKATRSMIEQEHPKPALNPPDWMRQDVDKTHFEARLKDENERVHKMNAHQRNERVSARQAFKDSRRDRDLDRGTERSR